MSSTLNILPDSRTREQKGVVRHAKFGNQVRVFCANCGKFGGHVPENWVTHVFYMCQECADMGLGKMAHDLYVEPDHVWQKRAAESQIEEFGDFLTLQELTKQLEDPSSTMSKIAREWQAHVRKVG